jgi:hypothetical protein
VVGRLYLEGANGERVSDFEILVLRTRVASWLGRLLLLLVRWVRVSVVLVFT